MINFRKSLRKQLWIICAEKQLPQEARIDIFNCCANDKGLLKSASALGEDGVGGLRKTCFIGLDKVKAQTTFTLAAYNLSRMATIFGWRLNTGQGEIRPLVAERQPKPPKWHHKAG
jgi:hypothetical protein